MSSEIKERLLKDKVEHIHDELKFKFDLKNILIIVGDDKGIKLKTSGDERFFNTCQKAIDKILNEETFEI